MLPIAPPMVHREWVDGSGPKRSPCGAAALVIASRTAPGSATAVRSPWSTDSTRFRCLEVSRTTPAEMALPAMDVPAPRATTGTPSSRHTVSAAMISSDDRGKATTWGTTR